MADVVPLPATLPRLAHSPTTRMIDSSGRFSALIAGQNLVELCGWAPGPLLARTDGAWEVLTADPGGGPVRRFDGRPSVSATGRVRLPEPVLYRLGLEPGQEVALLPLPEHRAVALCHPARLLIGAPLTLLHDPDEAQEEP